jgi:hypothetical protein
MFGLVFEHQHDSGDLGLNIFRRFTKRIKTLYLHTATHPFKAYYIDLEETFPSLEYLFLRNSSLQFTRPIPM